MSEKDSKKTTKKSTGSSTETITKSASKDDKDQHTGDKPVITVTDEKIAEDLIRAKVTQHEAAKAASEAENALIADGDVSFVTIKLHRDVLNTLTTLSEQFEVSRGRVLTKAVGLYSLCIKERLKGLKIASVGPAEEGKTQMIEITGILGTKEVKDND